METKDLMDADWVLSNEFGRSEYRRVKIIEPTHIPITAKGYKKEDAVKVIISDIEYEIDSLTEIKDKIKSAYKL